MKGSVSAEYFINETKLCKEQVSESQGESRAMYPLSHPTRGTRQCLGSSNQSDGLYSPAWRNKCQESVLLPVPAMDTPSKVSVSD